MSSQAKVRGGDISYAKHDPATALASIFRPTKKGEKRQKGLEVQAEFGGCTLLYTCWEYLDSLDQTVLLAAIGMAGMQDVHLTGDAPGPIGQQLWLELMPEETATNGYAAIVITSRYALLEAAGMSKSKNDYERLKSILYRLAQVGCRAKMDGNDWSMRLLSYAAQSDGTIHIALNQRLAAALAGQHVKVSLDERRQLSGDITKILHVWLSASIRSGATSYWMRLDTLAERVWGEEAADDTTLRDRRSKMRLSLKEIAAKLGWKVEVKGIGARSQAQITRPNVIDAAAN